MLFLLLRLRRGRVCVDVGLAFVAGGGGGCVEALVGELSVDWETHDDSKLSDLKSLTLFIKTRGAAEVQNHLPRVLNSQPGMGIDIKGSVSWLLSQFPSLISPDKRRINKHKSRLL